MHEKLDAIATALENLGLAITNGWASDATFNETWGWNCPPLSRHDLAAYPERLAARLREANLEEVDVETLDLIEEMPRKIALIQANVLPQLWGGNNPVVCNVIMTTIEVFTAQIEPLLGWQTLSDPKSMPSNLAKRVRSLTLQLDQVVINKDELTNTLNLIRDTHEVANNLPVNLDDLKQAQVKLEKANEQAGTLLEKIKGRESESETKLSEIITKGEAADQIVDKCEEGYRITTTKGLAAAFDQRAASLNLSMKFWVFGLIVALVVGSSIASTLFDAMIKLLSAPNVAWGVVTLDLIIAILSVGAPVWFAWMSTKQIGQRFRLAEDYAYKASVAKAYEGYKKEAVALDPDFATRLFSSALTRLEEAPLRLVEEETHGSPWHELFKSKAFDKALNRIPELGEWRDKILDSVSSNLRRNAESEAEKVVAKAAEKE